MTFAARFCPVKKWRKRIKLSAEQADSTAESMMKYPERVEDLNKCRGMLANNVKYAEAFRVRSVESYLWGGKDPGRDGLGQFLRDI